MSLPRRYFSISKYEDGDENGDLTYARSTSTEESFHIKHTKDIPTKEYHRNRKRKKRKKRKELDSYQNRKDFYKDNQDIKKCLDFNLVPKYLTKEEQLKKVYETIDDLNKRNAKKDKITRKTTIRNNFRTIK
jgi:hypothetical protein